MQIRRQNSNDSAFPDNASGYKDTEAIDINHSSLEKHSILDDK